MKLFTERHIKHWWQEASVEEHAGRKLLGHLAKKLAPPSLCDGGAS
jgi:hypothetical protein